MIIEVLVEESSAEAALLNILPKMIPSGAVFNIHTHQGKQDLLSNLSNRLRAYRKFMTKDIRLVVLVDKDRDNCYALKSKLESAAEKAGLMSKSKAQGKGFHVLNRLAIEELEAWFFGDPQAISKAFPKVPLSIFNRAQYRIPDSIKGGTAEALAKILKDYRYYPTGMPKIEVARKISVCMDPMRNKSKSFQAFRKGMEAVTGHGGSGR
jgi:hypothetical protein